MIKRLLSAICLSVAMIWSVVAVAQTVGLVDMRQIFQTAPQIKDINTRLEKQFSPQREKMTKLTQSLQQNLQKLKRDEAVMGKKEAENLRKEIQNDESTLRQQQQQFQQELFVAQNKAMSDFMSKVNGAVKKVAERENLDLVLPKDTVLYAKNSKDITSNVVSALK
ncbi:OmpH family outer membrane protein [Coxiella burnetii]|uniref:OmpH family outer membrane protein n=1 Tax=Coxiella burnetii TaxID=777 RepID=UPI00016313D2|nr:OmpH family outer membrane protein [Coxiella burnetii]ACJ20609.1 outer membrane protein [Coxiella burnetii CbuK_Q154]EAX31825.2 hypothetical protein A35_07325 [Coxiella burnetii 'MSU Goat Q177']UYK70250.1 OmpH family outer membrane protein [Coxiella burnetii]